MMFSGSKLLAVALTLASCITASPTLNHKRTNDESVTIGYRTVSEEQAAIYNEHGTIVYKGILLESSLVLVFTLPTSMQAEEDSIWSWSVTFTNSPLLSSDSYTFFRFCIVTADRAAMERVSKVWVPEKYHGEDLWLGPIDPKIREETLRKYDEKMSRYIKGLRNDYTPEATLRFGRLVGWEPQDQMLIPPFLASPEGGLNLRVHCAERSDLIEEYMLSYIRDDIFRKNCQGHRD
ncbi:uncharacterized protein MCYG_08469 [Microsporum canis CBS 113480]|uniref:Uncharacterized protein n=1 Tax=Arthroderma otae (strain ATCC MYA-4605 / CBS 113480) TaxID=554155 RepID=C5G0J7_ARTOC|nr:uncharacterized protein MCYG_08469 [Microsporum canis CBS 113480]EEQ35650.1 predicted protein [Microsporum canis CBS 113480]